MNLYIDTFAKYPTATPEQKNAWELAVILLIWAAEDEMPMETIQGNRHLGNFPWETLGDWNIINDFLQSNIDYFAKEENVKHLIYAQKIWQWLHNNV